MDGEMPGRKLNKSRVFYYRAIFNYIQFYDRLVAGLERIISNRFKSLRICSKVFFSGE